MASPYKKITRFNWSKKWKEVGRKLAGRNVRADFPSMSYGTKRYGEVTVGNTIGQ